jgi:hypothetical protein
METTTPTTSTMESLLLLHTTVPAAGVVVIDVAMYWNEKSPRQNKTKRKNKRA